MCCSSSSRLVHDKPELQTLNGLVVNEFAKAEMAKLSLCLFPPAPIARWSMCSTPAVPRSPRQRSVRRWRGCTRPLPTSSSASDSRPSLVAAKRPASAWSTTPSTSPRSSSPNSDLPGYGTSWIIFVEISSWEDCFCEICIWFVLQILSCYSVFVWNVSPCVKVITSIQIIFVYGNLCCIQSCAFT